MDCPIYKREKKERRDEDNEKNDQANVCFMANDENNETILVGSRDNNVYSIQLNDLANQNVKCLSAISETSWLWHRRLGHMHMEHLKDISSKELVRGLPKIKFEKDKEFEMSMMGELTFFLGLQIKQSKDGIFINQAKYTKELLKRFDVEASNAFDTPMSSSLKLDKDEKGKDADIKRYRGLLSRLGGCGQWRWVSWPELQCGIALWHRRIRTVPL
ncbi:hypothetical protein RJ640_009544 [Escallonia rubra]|uniref:GAG-pre-integrase domain-containing protein n=1 Tax=Escallonia rubra TaxID=112253 RepID=A0AA88U0Q1_9ASTE|nr:hypothetical protein RJ640_009544 [Escallonia rubra]